MKTRLFLFVLPFLLSSCQLLSELTSLSKCDFKLDKVSNTTLAGVNVQNLNSFSSLNLFDAGRVTASILRGKLPLSFDLDVEIKNPNTTSAALERTEWIVLIDGLEMAKGNSSERISIPPNGGTATMPIQVELDLKEVLKGESKDALLNMAFNLADASGKPTRITMKLKPSVVVAGAPLVYPGYVTVNSTYSGAQR